MYINPRVLIDRYETCDAHLSFDALKTLPTSTLFMSEIFQPCKAIKVFSSLLFDFFLEQHNTETHSFQFMTFIHRLNSSHDRDIEMENLFCMGKRKIY